MVQVQLPVMRKIFAAVHLLQRAYAGGGPTGSDKTYQKILAQTNDSEELRRIMEYLGLRDQVDEFSIDEMVGRQLEVEGQITDMKQAAEGQIEAQSPDTDQAYA